MSSLGASGQDLLSWAFIQTATGSFYINGSFTTENNPFPEWWGTGILLRPAVDTAAVVVIEPASGRIAVNRTDAGHWMEWQYLAIATPPQQFDLPMADGLIQSSASWYSKDQFGQVHVHGAISAGSGSLGWDTLVATLPEGYRPSAKLESAAAFASGGENGPGAVAVSTDGTIKVFPDISAAQKAAYFDLFFSAD